MLEIDALLKQNEDGIYDFILDANGDVVTVDNFDTAILMSLFAERRAANTEVPDAFLRRGWVGNIQYQDGFENGSKLWLLAQAREDQATLNAAINYTKQGLSWMVNELNLKAVNVDASYNQNGILIEIQLVHASGHVHKQLYTLWSNTLSP